MLPLDADCESDDLCLDKEATCVAQKCQCNAGFRISSQGRCGKLKFIPHT